MVLVLTKLTWWQAMQLTPSKAAASETSSKRTAPAASTGSSPNAQHDSHGSKSEGRLGAGQRQAGLPDDLQRADAEHARSLHAFIKDLKAY